MKAPGRSAWLASAIAVLIAEVGAFGVATIIQYSYTPPCYNGPEFGLQDLGIIFYMLTYLVLVFATFGVTWMVAFLLVFASHHDRNEQLRPEASAPPRAVLGVNWRRLAMSLALASFVWTGVLVEAISNLTTYFPCDHSVLTSTSVLVPAIVGTVVTLALATLTARAPERLRTLVLSAAVIVVTALAAYGPWVATAYGR